MEIGNLHAYEIQELLVKKEISAVELVEYYIKNIENDDLNAFISLNTDKALEKAKLIDEKIAKGEKLGKLAGLVIAVKDNIVTKDFKTTAASKMLENYKSPFNASVVERIEKEDGIIIGKTNLDEFACGSSGETSYFGPSLNPINRDRTTGGSSSGSAAAVGAGLVPIALGSDTGGSIRQPSSFCGVVGLRPSYGLVSRSGLIALANSLDQIGPLARSVNDIALILSVISGEDKKDSTTLGAKSVDKNLEEVKNVKIALPKIAFGDITDDQVKEVILDNLESLGENNISLDYIDMESFDFSETAYYLLSRIEASSNLSRYDGVHFGYRTENYETLDDMYKNTRKEALGYEIRKRVISGTYMLRKENRDKYYTSALKMRGKIVEEFNKIFEEYDYIITPTTPDIAFNVGSDQGSSHKSDIFTLPSSLAGLPSISLPYGEKDGMPIGVQLIGKRWDDKGLLNLAYTLENKLSNGGDL